jgi:hypothetical protein
MKNSFGEFVDKKSREAKKQLSIVREMLQRNGMKVADFVESDEENPYIFVHNPQSDSSFGGVRIYKIADKIAFRIAREEKTHPYGRAYALKIPEMFNDYVSDDFKQEEAGKKVIESVVKEVQKFFATSAKAERDLQVKGSQVGTDDPLGRVLIQNVTGDISDSMGAAQP